MSKKSRHNGFTLIEFLISLVVIGFIVGLLISYFSNPLSDARLSRDVSRVITDATSLADASNRYFIRHSAYPSWFQDLVDEGILYQDLTTSAAYLLADFNTGWEQRPTNVTTGDGTTHKMVVLDLPDKPSAVRICKGLNERVLGLAADANIPSTTGSDKNWGTRPAETVGQSAFCVEVGGNMFYFQQI